MTHRVSLALTIAIVVLLARLSPHFRAFSPAWPASCKKILGPVTPIGGLLMITGWATLAMRN